MTEPAATLGQPNLMCPMCGRKPTQTRGEHADSTQKDPTPAGYQTQDLIDVRQADLHPSLEPSCCEATGLPIVPISTKTSQPTIASQAFGHFGQSLTK